ncbi:MAG: hypothetical protein JNM17_21180 [Archangium sp.]|nr:hypothetical protein [Archangium sp.]
MLDSIQEHLENIYGIRCEYRARDFLVTDAEAARQLGGSARSREELLVSEGSDGLELALYLDPVLLSRVTAARGPLDADLGDFCEVAEGVSHFLYVAHTAELNRSVSLLELEAQAEVDKFAICTLLGWSRHVGRWAGTLVKRLFDEVQFRERLDAGEQWRYAEANRLGRRYASRLMPMVKEGRLESFLSELRHAYRLGAEAKLAYFAR